MVNVYIDESGNLGRGGEFFTIAAIAFSTSQGMNRLKRLMRKACLDFSSSETPLREVKANALSFPQKQELLQKNVITPRPWNLLYNGTETACYYAPAGSW